MQSEAPQSLPAQGHYEPHLTMVKLPRCPNEHCPNPKHPLAYNPPMAAAECPGCGGPTAAPEEPIEVDATFVGGHNEADL